MTDINKQKTQDEQLGEFTDRVLKGQMKNSASDSNEELRGLEETVLRLHNSMPAPASLEESEKKKMYVRLNARIRRESEKEVQKKSFWSSLFSAKWMNSQSRPQIGMAIGVFAVLIVAAVISPALGYLSPSTATGTALTRPQNITLAFVLIGLMAIALLIKRKK